MSHKSRPLVKEFLCSGIHKSTKFSNELGVPFPRNSTEEKNPLSAKQWNTGGFKLRDQRQAGLRCSGDYTQHHLTDLGEGKCPLDIAQTPLCWHPALNQVPPLAKTTETQCFSHLFIFVLLEFIPVSSHCPHTWHHKQIQAGEINLMERFLIKHTRIRQPQQLQVWSSNNKPGPGCLKGVKWSSNIGKG